MSEHGSTSGASATESRRRPATVKDLIGKAHDKLGHSGPLSLTEHLSAAKTLRSIRDRIAGGERPDQKTQVLLMCTGIACYRRWSVGESGLSTSTTGSGSAKDEAAETRMNEEARELVRGTASRLFLLLCMAEKQKDRTLDVETAQQAVATAGLTSVWAQLRPKPVPKKKSKKQQRARVSTDDGNVEMEEEEELDEEDRREQASWEIATRLSMGEVARHALTLGVSCLGDDSNIAMDKLMPFFFRAAGANMAESMLMPSGDNDFVSLAMAKPMAELKGDERTKRLTALAIAAESEAGQSVIRDLLLSFLLPASHVGVRRTLLLTRASSTRAGVDYPELTSRGHEVACVLALRTSEYTCTQPHIPPQT
tara:strand:- start:2418 stop:3518 length:1101 start_codon:yes stop_codon:yes gene_type:complete